MAAVVRGPSNESSFRKYTLKKLRPVFHVDMHGRCRSHDSGIVRLLRSHVFRCDCRRPPCPALLTARAWIRVTPNVSTAVRVLKVRSTKTSRWHFESVKHLLLHQRLVRLPSMCSIIMPARIKFRLERVRVGLPGIQPAEELQITSACIDHVGLVLHVVARDVVYTTVQILPNPTPCRSRTRSEALLTYGSVTA